ncbi:MAG: zinc ribbon-containing protein [Usitatibacter sp.]
MGYPNEPDKDGQAHRTRTRGAIRTHLGRKRSGARARPLNHETLVRVQQVTETARHRQEELFDRLMGQFQLLFDSAGERGAGAFEAALDTACGTLVSAGEFTAENAERLRQCLRRDLLHRDHPAMTFRTGDITTAGTLTCEGCGWTIQATRTTLLPACPQCVSATFRKAG